MSNAQLIYKAFSVNAEGHGSNADVEIEIDSADGTFAIDLPHYVVAIVRRKQALALTLRETVEQYESCCEEYQRVRLAHRGRNVLLLYTAARVQSTTDSDVPACGLSLAYETDTEVDGRLLRHEDVRRYRTVINDTPDNRAKLDAMIASMATAAKLLQGIAETSDPEAYLHAIELTGPVEVPAKEPEVMLDHFGSNGSVPVKSEPTPVANDEDEL